MERSGTHDVGAVPLIGVTGRRRPAKGLHTGPSSLDRLTLEVYFTGYADRITAAGGLPVHLPASLDPDTVADRLDGLVLTGGSDIDPTLYGSDAVPAEPP
ncbi:MAG: gamma-glutamyl-gamma-aminobutyrate hydrolase family protein, partial [Pseudonocardia sediminis]